MGDEPAGGSAPGQEKAKAAAGSDGGKKSGESAPWLQIAVALIGLTGVLGAAIIATRSSGPSTTPTAIETSTASAATSQYIDCSRATDMYPNWCVAAQPPETAICDDSQLRRLENCYLSYCDDPRYTTLCKAGLTDWLELRKNDLTGKCRSEAGAVDIACMTRVYNDRIKEFTGLGAMH
jgi:hypothetical protein